MRTASKCLFPCVSLMAVISFGGSSSVHADAPAGRYTVVAGSPTVVVDNVTGLIWKQNEEPGEYLPSAAADRCASLGFRLPDVRELATIVDETRITSPAIDVASFKGPTGGLPTSRPVATSTLPEAPTWMVVYFADGTVGPNDPSDGSNTCVVRCVR